MSTPAYSTGYTGTDKLGASAWTPQDDRVDTEVSRITAAGGKLMQQAKTDGLAGAQRRGLLNSSMAVGSSQAAVLNAALPMAQQNAAQTAQKNLSSQEYGQSRGLQEQQGQITSGLQKEKFGYDTSLAEQKFGYDTSLSKQGYEQTRGLQEQKFGYDTSLEDQRFGNDSKLSKQNFDQTWAVNDQKLQQEYALADQQATNQAKLSDQDFRQKLGLLDVDNASKEKIASWNVSQYEKDRAMSALTAMEQLYAGEFSSITNNVDMPAEARNTYLNHIGRMRDSTLNLVEQMYGIDLNWASPDEPDLTVY
jgi:hypothetical protein